MTDRGFDIKVKKLFELQAQIDALEKEAEELKTAIKTEMLERKVDSITTLKYAAFWPLIISNKFDTTAFKKAHAGLYKQFSKPSESRRFTYKSIA